MNIERLLATERAVNARIVAHNNKIIMKFVFILFFVLSLIGPIGWFTWNASKRLDIFFNDLALLVPFLIGLGFLPYSLSGIDPSLPNWFMSQNVRMHTVLTVYVRSHDRHSDEQLVNMMLIEHVRETEAVLNRLV